MQKNCRILESTVQKIEEDESIVIWEHFGLMEREEYYFKACEKIRRYRQAGFKEHSNLICTWEQDLEDMNTIDEIIDRFIAT